MHYFLVGAPVQKLHKTMACKLSLFSSTLFSFSTEIPPHFSKLPARFPLSPSLAPQNFQSTTPPKSRTTRLAAAAEAAAEEVVAEGYTITQFIDKIIDVFMNEKPKSKDWKKYLIFRDEWKKYGERFYNRCKTRADDEKDPKMKQKLIDLSRRVKKIDDEMEKHDVLLKEIQDNPLDINAIVAKRRGDFTDNFFRHLTLISEMYDGLEDRDAIARLGTRCLSAVSAFDNTLEIVGTLDTAQEKFDNILNSPSIDVACEKIKSLAKAKELDSSLILLINGAWAAAKESATMKSEVKDIMYRLYKATQSSLRSIVPKEIKLLKYLLNIIDPEERFSALATAFSLGPSVGTCVSSCSCGSYGNMLHHCHMSRCSEDAHGRHVGTPKELHKWIKIMLDAYHLNQQETEIREAKKMDQPVVIQRLFILKETIEQEYMPRDTKTETNVNNEEQ